MIAGAEFERPERAVELEAAEGVDELLGVGRARLRDPGGQRLDRQIARRSNPCADSRGTVLIGGDERLVLRRRDFVPGIAGDDSAGRSLVLERIEIFRLAAEEVDDDAVLESE
jgi:hypothetical protein